MGDGRGVRLEIPGAAPERCTVAPMPLSPCPILDTFADGLMRGPWSSHAVRDTATANMVRALAQHAPRWTNRERARSLVMVVMVEVLTRHLRAVDALCDARVAGPSLAWFAGTSSGDTALGLRAAAHLLDVRLRDIGLCVAEQTAIGHAFDAIRHAKAAFAIVEPPTLEGWPEWASVPATPEEAATVLGSPWEVAAGRVAECIASAAHFASAAVFANVGGVAPDDRLEAPVQKLVAACAADLTLGFAVAAFTAWLVDHP